MARAGWLSARDEGGVGRKKKGAVPPLECLQRAQHAQAHTHARIAG